MITTGLVNAFIITHIPKMIIIFLFSSCYENIKDLLSQQGSYVKKL